MLARYSRTLAMPPPTSVNGISATTPAIIKSPATVSISSAPRRRMARRGRRRSVFPRQVDGHLRRRGHPLHRAQQDRSFYVQLWTLVPHATLNPTPEQLKPYETASRGPKFPHHGRGDLLRLGHGHGRAHRPVAGGTRQIRLADNTVSLFQRQRPGGHSRSQRRSQRRRHGRPVPRSQAQPVRRRRPPAGHRPLARPRAGGKIDDKAVVAGVDFAPNGLQSRRRRTARATSSADGEDVSDILLGQSRGPRTPLFWEWRIRIAGEPFHHSPILAIRDGDWKLLLNPDRSRVELYDIPTDSVGDEQPRRRSEPGHRRPAGGRNRWRGRQTSPTGPIDPWAGKNDYPWPKPRSELRPKSAVECPLTLCRGSQRCAKMVSIRCALMMLLLAAPLHAATGPNIVYILCDDLGYGDVQCLNPDGKIATPNIDRLAAAGMIFTDAHSSSAVCTPTRYGILTGRYNWRSRLQKRRAATAIQPRADRAGPAHRAGAAEAARLPHGLHRQVAPRHGLAAEGRRHREGLRRPVEGRLHRADRERPDHASASTTTSASAPRSTCRRTPSSRTIASTDAARRSRRQWIRKRRRRARSDFEAGGRAADARRRKAVEYIGARRRRKTGKPFFLYLPLNSPHTPIVPTQGMAGQERPERLRRLRDGDRRRGRRGARRAGQGRPRGQHARRSSPATTAARPGRELSGSSRARAITPATCSAATRPTSGTAATAFRSSSAGRARSSPARGATRLICLTDLMATGADIVGAKLPDNAGEDSVSILPALAAGRRSRCARPSCIIRSTAPSPSARASGSSNSAPAPAAGATRGRAGDDQSKLPACSSTT